MPPPDNPDPVTSVNQVNQVSPPGPRGAPTFHVVLVEPEIPPNTGNIARLCLSAGAALHLVGPLGFSTDDRTLRRAGMDYWKQVDVRRHESLAAFLAAHPAASGGTQLSPNGAKSYSPGSQSYPEVMVGDDSCPVGAASQDSPNLVSLHPAASRGMHLLTTKTRRPYWDARFQPGDYLVFGRETRGLPESLLSAHPDRCLTIPMGEGGRSLNLAVAAGIVLYEAVRQNRTRLNWAAGQAMGRKTEEDDVR